MRINWIVYALSFFAAILFRVLFKDHGQSWMQLSAIACIGINLWMLARIFHGMGRSRWYTLLGLMPVVAVLVAAFIKPVRKPA